MDKKKLFWKGMAVVVVAALIVAGIYSVATFKVVEETFALEVAKRVLVSIGFAGIVGCIAYPLVGTWANRKAEGLDKKK